MLDTSLESGLFSGVPADVDTADANRHLGVANEAVQRIKYARYLGFGLGALMLIRSAVEVYGGATAEGVGVAVQGTLYLALAYGCGRAPLVCLGALLGIYVIDLIAGAYLTPETMLSGLAFKVATVVVLGRGLAGAYRMRQARAALRGLGFTSARLRPLGRLQPVHL